MKFDYAISMNHGAFSYLFWVEFETNCCCPNSIRYVISEDVAIGISSPWGWYFMAFSKKFLKSAPSCDQIWLVICCNSKWFLKVLIDKKAGLQWQTIGLFPNFWKMISSDFCVTNFYALVFFMTRQSLFFLDLDERYKFVL